jgi:hypothetical protein
MEAHSGAMEAHPGAIEVTLEQWRPTLEPCSHGGALLSYGGSPWRLVWQKMPASTYVPFR